MKGLVTDPWLWECPGGEGVGRSGGWGLSLDMCHHGNERTLDRRRDRSLSTDLDRRYELAGGSEFKESQGAPSHVVPLGSLMSLW